MTITSTTEYLQQPYDCLILVHPQMQLLEETSCDIQSKGIPCLHISKGLSTSLIPLPACDRKRFSQNWLIDALSSFKNSPVLCLYPDLLFDPSFNLDPLAIFRQAARIIPLIVLWSGDYSGSTLSYAIPDHHHYRTWKVSASFLQQPVVVIHRISTSQGA